MSKVSVVVPIYNVEKYLNRCLDSLVNQSLQDIQIILVNDGSTDESGKIAKKYQKENPEKVIYLEKENGGLSDARNYGMNYADGEYIAFLDSDDYIEKDAYEKMYNKALEENSDYVECDFIWEYPDKIVKDIRLAYSNKKEMLQNVRVVAWNKLIRLNILKEYDIKFPKGLRYEDIEFTYKLIPYLDNCSYVNEAFIHYTQRVNSIVNVQNERTAEIFTILDNVIDYYKEHNFYTEYKAELEYNYARYLLCSSLKRMCKIRNKQKRKELINKAWEKLNDKFPNWNKNETICKKKNAKTIYLRTVNKFTLKIYTFILHIF